MISIDLSAPPTLSEEETTMIASRQLLEFLRVPTEAGPNWDAPSKRGFLLSALPEGANVGAFPWSTMNELFDVNGRLLFRDYVLDQGRGAELRIRTAASDLLRAPVWAVSSGPKLDLAGLTKVALSAMKNATIGSLKPIKFKGRVNWVVYSYPKIGIRCTLDTSPADEFIFDIGDHSVTPVNAFMTHSDPEDVTIAWSPFDTIAPSTIGLYRARWRKHFDSLPQVPARAANLKSALEATESTTVEERSVNPELQIVGQETDVYCALATAQMLLAHHGVIRSQDEIAEAMQVGRSGTSVQNQLSGFAVLSENMLAASLDETTSFSDGKLEILSNRPFKSGIPGHARACGGFKVQDEKCWLYIYDPWPPRQGSVYYENWDAVMHTNFIYLRQRQFQ